MNIKLKHKTKNRARFIVLDIKSLTDTKALKKEILNIKFISQVRINKLAKSIIIEYSSNLALIEDELRKLDINKFVNFQKDFDSNLGKSAVVNSLLPLPFMLFNVNSLNLALSSFAGMGIFKDAFNELLESGITSKVLEASAVGVSLARGDYLAANVTNAMINFGEYVEEETMQKSDDLIKELAKPSVENAWIVEYENGEPVEKMVKAKDLKVGDIVVVNSGDIIPVDGQVVSKSAMVNQVSMTGEAKAVEKHYGDKVISGTIVEEGRLKVWAEQVGENTATEHIKKYIQSSLNEKSSIGLKANNLAEKLVPVTLGLAILAYIAKRDLGAVASVLQADYSCALKLATPVAFKSAISQCGKDGILVKGSKTIEALSAVDTFIFDKTGTLTTGKLEVVNIVSFDKNWSQKDILNLAASTEEHYFHPMAQAIVDAAKVQGFKHMHHSEVKFIVAHGVKTEVDSKVVVIGSRHFLEEDEGISFVENEKAIDGAIEKGRTLLYVGFNGKLLGMIAMIDKVRLNSKAALQALKKLGVKKTIMLTGDIDEKAKQIAKEVGIDEYYSELLPTQKAEIVKEIKQSGAKIAFVGDGINDAPALVNADVGFSMSKGADIAKASADISLLKDDIFAIVEAKEIANKTIKRIDTHFKATVGVNSGILLGASLGMFSPITTSILHNGTTMGLLFNSIANQKLNFRENKV